MTQSPKPKTRRRWQLTRRFTLLLMSLGISSEMVAIIGMVLGILAGGSFMATGDAPNPAVFWSLGMVFCLLRIFCIRLERSLQLVSTRQSMEEAFFNELPERVSDAVTLIGFGFALDSDPWLGLAAALSAIFSAYIRSIAFSRTANGKSASSGPMTRVHRLVLLSVTSLLLVLGVSNENLRTTIPQIALWVIVIGCSVTVCIRWYRMKGIKV